IDLFAYVHVGPEPPGSIAVDSLHPSVSVTSTEVFVVRKVVVGLLGASLVTSVGIMLPTVASAAPPVDPTPAAKADSNPALIDDLPNPLEDKRRALREQAVADVVSGKAKPQKRNGSTVLKVGRTQGSGVSNRAVAKAGTDQYVELSRERTDRIFVILAEFGNERAPGY